VSREGIQYILTGLHGMLVPESKLSIDVHEDPESVLTVSYSMRAEAEPPSALSVSRPPTIDPNDVKDEHCDIPLTESFVESWKVISSDDVGKDILQPIGDGQGPDAVTQTPSKMHNVSSSLKLRLDFRFCRARG
jgi:hypothetical protein